MGASESSLISSRSADEGITTVSERAQIVDPILEKIQSLKITQPILTSAPAESSLTDILVRKPFSSSSETGTVNPNVLLELFSMYRDWQEQKSQTIIKRQGDIENKIEVVDALAVKLLQRYNYSVSAMKTTANHLSEVHDFQVELGELKGRLTEVISNCDALCKKIIAEGPESLKSSLEPFTASCSSRDSSNISEPTVLPPSAQEEEEGSKNDNESMPSPSTEDEDQTPPNETL